MSKVKGGNLRSCPFSFCPLTSSFCLLSETLSLTLFWALFLQVKKFPSLLSPECISILLWRGTKGSHLSVQDRYENDSLPDFQPIHMFLAQPRHHHLLYTNLLLFTKVPLFSVGQSARFSLVSYFVPTSLLC